MSCQWAESMKRRTCKEQQLQGSSDLLLSCDAGRVYRHLTITRNLFLSELCSPASAPRRATGHRFKDGRHVHVFCQYLLDSILPTWCTYAMDHNLIVVLLAKVALRVVQQRRLHVLPSGHRVSKASHRSHRVRGMFPR